MVCMHFDFQEGYLSTGVLFEGFHDEVEYWLVCMCCICMGWRKHFLIWWREDAESVAVTCWAWLREGEQRKSC